jgi:hypothetical protein
MIMWLIIMASLTTMGIVLFANVRPDNIELTIMLATPLTFALPVTLTFLLTSKVQFDSDRVIQSSIFGTKELMLENIKSFGVFEQSRFSCWLVDAETATENSLFDSPLFFLSESKTFDLNKWRQKRTIRLQFRRDVYNKIKDWVLME